MTVQHKIILGVSGSIAAYKSADIIRRLSDKGIRSMVVMTYNAEKFITPLTLSCLSGGKVYQGMLEDDEPWKMPHVNLAKEAEAFLIAPATANIIGKLAHGIIDDLLTCLAVTVRCPIIIAPAMNSAMYESQALQENIQILKKRGCVFVDPIEGELACGVVGKGHLAEVKEIVREVEKAII